MRRRRFISSAAVVREALPLRGAAAPLRSRRALRGDVARAEGPARGPQNSALASRHVDVTRRVEVAAVDELRVERARSLVGDRGPDAAREHDRVVRGCRRSSRRGSPPRRGARARGRRRAGRAPGRRRARSPRGSRSSPSAASPQRSDAPGPRAQSAQCTTRVRVESVERVRPFDHDDLVEPA